MYRASRQEPLGHAFIESSRLGSKKAQDRGGAKKEVTVERETKGCTKMSTFSDAWITFRHGTVPCHSASKRGRVRLH